MSESDFSKRLFLKLIDNCKLVEAGKDYTIYEYEVVEDAVNTSGTLHGGLTSTLLDYCMANTVAQEKAHQGIPVEICISFMNSAFLGDILVIESHLVKKGNSLAFLAGEVFDKKTRTPIAIAKQTVSMVKAKL